MNYKNFPDNRYSKWYIELMTSRQFQEKEKTVTEAHHIFPVSIFGKNEFVINLTHREHYIAHMLLWKMYAENTKENRKMVYAFKAMCQLHNNINLRDII